MLVGCRREEDALLWPKSTSQPLVALLERVFAEPVGAVESVKAASEIVSLLVLVVTICVLNFPSVLASVWKGRFYQRGTWITALASEQVTRRRRYGHNMSL